MANLREMALNYKPNRIKMLNPILTELEIIQAKLKLIPNNFSVCLEDLNEVRLIE